MQSRRTYCVLYSLFRLLCTPMEYGVYSSMYRLAEQYKRFPTRKIKKKIKVFNYLKRDYSPLYKLKGLVRLAARLRFAFYDSLQALK